MTMRLAVVDDGGNVVGTFGELNMVAVDGNPAYFVVGSSDWNKGASQVEVDGLLIGVGRKATFPIQARKVSKAKPVSRIMTKEELAAFVAEMNKKITG